MIRSFCSSRSLTESSCVAPPRWSFACGTTDTTSPMESAWAPGGANNKTGLAGTNKKAAIANIEKRAIIISVLPPDFRLLHDHRIFFFFFFHALVDELYLLFVIM